LLTCFFTRLWVSADHLARREYTAGRRAKTVTRPINL
jgi:hypothetical protein